MALERSIVLLKMKAALKAGQSATSFISAMREAGLSYRRQTMLADWRSVSGVAEKEGLARYIRKDYRPTAATIAQVQWGLSREYMTTVQVQARLRPTEPSTTRFVNVMSDTPLTPHEVEQAVLERLVDWSDSIPGVVERITPWTVLQRVAE